MVSNFLDAGARPAHTTHAPELDAATYEVVLALCIGFSIPGLLPPLLHSEGVPPEQLMARARAAGLVQADGRPSEELRATLLKDAEVYQVRRLQRALVDLYCVELLPLGRLARRLASDGFADGRIAGVLEDEGTALLGTDPQGALELLELAVAAGAEASRTAPRRAEAALSVGDLDAASRILEGYFAHHSPEERKTLPDLPRALRVSCALWAGRGMMSRAADVQRWAATLRPPEIQPLGALALLAAGDAAGARRLLELGGHAPSPSLQEAADTLLMEGAQLSLAADPSGALPKLIRASDTLDAAGRVSPSPELPAGFAAIVGLLAGNPQTALSLIQAALASGQGGHGMRPRLCLLGGWAAMLLDQPAAARGFITEAGRTGLRPGPRDELLLQSLEVGLARRAGEASALVRTWQKAREALLHVSVDLLTVLPLSELLIAGARLRDAETLRPHLDEAWQLLANLGNPPLWSVPLHWSAVQAALLLERPDDLPPHAAALAGQAATYPLAATFATAGKAWVSVLAEHFDTDAVETASRGLAAAGFSWEGARLAGHASAKAGDRRDMTKLLSCARDLRPARDRTARPEVRPQREAAAHPTAGSPRPVLAPARAVPGNAPHRGGPALSGREREIAQLVLLGRTYREISEEIFISPRTVEHHVARIRRRFGASSRSDLLARLRVSLEPSAGSTGGGYATEAPNGPGRNP
ncbi:helix-turn-helix transcriptional regulator [Arthrobacter agilis]|uniref:helix-turn-helix transcriptional regulator n=1 Tax=Arthrobacter agilis TaxID=37921 RepID=UPI002785B7A8|nr:helix-turn-helix transcriptional regulator [Arthrobacter agilis]MDQ0734029.1 DNA-binding CsgD family transcriptional regulator [Arthrobacter agilis]